jgi:signal transduction histidine kinase
VRDVRISLRARLTVVYGSLFFVTGTLLVAVTYFFTVRAVNAKFKVHFPAPKPSPGVTRPRSNEVVYGMQGDLQSQIAQHRRAILNQLIQSSVLTVVVLGLVAVGLGYLVAGRMLRPLQTVTATARRLSESTLHERIGLTGPRDEIKDLADTFDSMLDRLHQAFDSQRRFIANASHELRTPLAINRTAIEVTLARAGTPPETKALARKLLVANARNERLIEGLLLLARSERELSTRMPADLADLARGALDQLRPAAEEARITIEAALSSGVTTGDVILLERSVINLVENAIKYNAIDGRVWVRTGTVGALPYLVVENTGPVVSAEDTAVMFEPFRRLRSDRVRSARGTGLGLSIVRAVVQAHGGSVETVPRSSGGLAIMLRLPPVPVEVAAPSAEAGARR